MTDGRGRAAGITPVCMNPWMMETSRVAVECLTDFGDLVSANIIRSGSQFFVSSGTDHVFVYSGRDNKVKVILQLDSPLICSRCDQHCLYVLCENNGLYCSSLPHEHSSTLSAEKCDKPLLSKLTRDSLIMKGEEVRSFIVAEDILVTVSVQDCFWNFDLYKVQKCSTESSICHKYAGFQVPSIAMKLSRNTVDAQARDWSSSTPALACIYPCKDSSLISHHSLLEPLLFRLLFGVDASLLHSPVILCGLPDGRLLYFPILLPALTRTQGGQKPTIKMLYSLEQPVTFIGTSNTAENGPQCLVVAGQRGKVVLAMVKQSGLDGKMADCCFLEHTVPGPVTCASVDGEGLYYSTSTNLFAVPLSKMAESSSSLKASAAEGESLFFLSPVCLNVCRVIALAEPHTTTTGAVTATELVSTVKTIRRSKLQKPFEGCVQLLAISLSGRLLQITLPNDLDKDAASVLPSSQLGQKVKDLLAGIGNVWERASSLKHQLLLKNNILKHLNQVLNIWNMLLTSQKSHQECKPPIACHGVANWQTLLQRDTLLLTCILENSSVCALDEGWTLCIEIQSYCAQYARTYSFALKKLDCGQRQEVTIPLEIDGDAFLPVMVQCFLVYSIQSLLCTEEPRHLSTRDNLASQLLPDRGCVCLPLNTFTLDWIEFLRRGQTSSPADFSRQITNWEATHMFLSSRQIHTEDETGHKTGSHSVSVQVSTELLRTRLSVKDCVSAVLCVTVLKWLVYGTSAGDGQTPVQGPVLCVHSPDGHAVRLSAKEVILNDVSSEGPLSVVEVQVESFSLVAVCGLHHSVLRRVQSLLKDSALKHENLALLKGQHLCETVRHVESLYKDLHSRASDAFGGVRRTRKISDALFQLYLQLREKPLVIL